MDKLLIWLRSFIPSKKANLRKRDKIKHSYSVHYEYLPDYLCVNVTGERDSIEISLKIWADIIKVLKKTKYRKLLVIEDIKGIVSPAEMYQIAEYLSTYSKMVAKAAFVDLDMNQYELNKFGETIVQNRGLAARVFNNIRQAEDWILEE